MAVAAKKEVLRRSKAWHITQEAIDVCNRLRLDPSDALVWLDGEVQEKTEVRDMRTTLEGAFRKVCQVEGVVLKLEQREMIKNLLQAILDEVKKP